MKTLLALLLFTATAWAEPVIVVSDDMDLPQTIVTSEGTYIVIPDYTTGKPMAVIETTKTDND
jgi:hypothetical protein